MPGTLSHIYVHYVFAVKGRHNSSLPAFEEEVYKYIAGIVKGKGQKSLAVNGMPDHVHMLVGLKPAMRIDELVRDIKNNATNFINDKGWIRQKFSWQEGYGAFSCSHSSFGNVIDYIKDQKARHQRRTFKEEYNRLLNKFEIPFEEKYLFEFYD